MLTGKIIHQVVRMVKDVVKVASSKMLVIKDVLPNDFVHLLWSLKEWGQGGNIPDVNSLGKGDRIKCYRKCPVNLGEMSKVRLEKV